MAVDDFVSKHPKSSIDDVFLVIHPQNQSVKPSIMSALQDKTTAAMSQTPIGRWIKSFGGMCALGIEALYVGLVKVPFQNILGKGEMLVTTLGKMLIENIVGKRENAGNQHFLLFPLCFLPDWKITINPQLRLSWNSF